MDRVTTAVPAGPISPPTSVPAAEPPATLDDLMRVDGKAELINDRIVPLMPSGHRPGRVAARILSSLDAHAEATGIGVACTGGVGFAVARLRSGRQSFSPDAAYYVGPLPANEDDFLPGAPTLAVEVRSKSDHGPAAEAELAGKRLDYFEAGTLVVWDVDPDARLIRSIAATDPAHPRTFQAPGHAHAEPAVPGWAIPVDRTFA